MTSAVRSSFFCRMFAERECLGIEIDELAAHPLRPDTQKGHLELGQLTESESIQAEVSGPERQLDTPTREVLVQGDRPQLPAREFALLHALLERPGAILSRDQLESRIYGWGEEVSSNAVDVLIHGMRRKLGADTIRNVRGLGWRVTGGALGVAS